MKVPKGSGKLISRKDLERANLACLFGADFIAGGYWVQGEQNLHKALDLFQQAVGLVTLMPKAWLMQFYMIKEQL